MTFFKIFFWPFLASLFMGLLLNLLGSQLASRDKTVQSLVMSQGALFGVLLGIGLAPLFFQGEFAEFFPFLTATLATALTFLISDRTTEPEFTHKTSALIVIYTFLLASGSLLGAFLPGVELHLSHKFFGDLATLSDSQSKIALLSSILGLLIFAKFGKEFTRDSFEIGVFGFKAKRNFTGILFLLMEFLIISYAVIFFGFLFTVACLFTGTTAMSFLNKKGGLRRHFILSSLLTVFACFAGFLSSLLNTQVPTVPAIVFFLVALGCASSLKGNNCPT